MVENFLRIAYDPVKKIWSSVHYPFKDQVQGSLGEIFLKSMRTLEANKIIDYFYDTKREKTAKEVYEESITVAKNLQRLGIKKGDVVVFFCMNNEDVAVLTMGCILIGAIVSFFEVHLQEEDVDYVIRILEPTVILYEEKYKHKCLQSLERVTFKSCKFAISVDGETKPNIKDELLILRDNTDFDKFESVRINDPENELALLALTSGSTGTPKVVQLSHTLLIHGCYIWWNNKNNFEPLNKNSVVFSFSPLRWISQGMMLLESMLMGIKRVSSCGAPSGDYGLEVLRRTQVTHLFVAPSIFQNILLQLPEDDVESLKSLKVVCMGGEPASTVLINLAKKHCINAKIFKCYGMTEMSTCITNDENINGGLLLPGYQMQILDDQYKPLGPNQMGQIAIKPPYALKGYKGIDCKTYFNENGLFINGDYGYVDEEGKLHLLARYKDLIYSNNLVLIPNILEHFIMELPEIVTARLAGYRKSPDDKNEIAAIFVVLGKSINVPENEVTTKIYNILKSKLSPEELDVIKDVYYEEAVPVTTCGKVDRVALKSLALNKYQIK